MFASKKMRLIGHVLNHILDHMLDHILDYMIIGLVTKAFHNTQGKSYTNIRLETKPLKIFHKGFYTVED